MTSMLKINTAHGAEERKVVSQEEWIKARKELLLAEKEFTKRSDEIAKKRLELPWTKVEKDYCFDTGEGKLSLADLFKGRSQLIIYHFMFGPDYKAGCPSCSAVADGFNGSVTHLKNHDVMLWAVSRAPLVKLQAYEMRMGWTFPWASSFESDFNFDFKVSFTEEQQRQGIDYNYTVEPPMKEKDDVAKIPSRSTPDKAYKPSTSTGTDQNTYARERPGMSAFALQDGVVYHTYSAYSRGVDGIWGLYPWLDRAPKGRNEDGYWFHLHDEYPQTPPVTDPQKKGCCH
jgi:predicted dithiol-disulfide oxidoreductase (DUF899 family)